MVGFIKSLKKKNNLVLHDYEKPVYNISVQEFYKYCDNGKYIDIDKF